MALEGPSETYSLRRALHMIQRNYPYESTKSTISHHAFVRTAPSDLQKEISNFVWTPRIIQEQFPNKMIVNDVFHEIYWMRPEFDLVDDKKIHYDGVLKVLFPSTISTIRSLTYMKGNTATFFALTSQQNFTTRPGTAVAIDFNRELHYAQVHSQSDESSIQNEPRIMIKAAIHVFPPDTSQFVVWLYIASHRVLFFSIKSLRNVFESTNHQSQRQRQQQQTTITEEGSFGRVAIMALDNTMRGLNKIHTILPLIMIGIPIGTFAWASFSNLPAVLPFVIHIAIVWWLNIPPSMAFYLRMVALIVSTSTVWILQRTKTTIVSSLILLQLAWICVCWYMEQNAEMANRIAFAAIPSPIIPTDHVDVLVEMRL